MELNKYQMLAMRTSPEGHDRVKNGMLGLIGESGELVDEIKKWMFQSGENAELPREKLIKELGDIMWYLAELATGMGMKLMVFLTSEREHFFEAYIDEPYHHIAARMAACAVNVYDSPGDEFRLSRASDMYVLILVLCRRLNVTITEVLEGNIEKLRKRYPDGFDPERSLNRAE